MKVVVIVNKPVVKLPEVGQMWKHGNIDKNIYMRIDSEQGALAVTMGGNNFYSVNLENGRIVYTSKDNTDIILLEPVGGYLDVKAIS